MKSVTDTGVVTRYCVLDVETAVSESAASLAAAGERPGVARVALHELVAGAVLLFERTSTGGFGGIRLVNAGAEGEDEPGMLTALHRVLDEAHASGAHLVTWNGVHDLTILRRRAGRHWLFDRLCYDEWPAEGGGRHLDLMRLDVLSAGGRWPSLLDAAAGFGVNGVCPRMGRTSAVLSPQVRKAEVDVVTTAIMLFHHLAMEERAVDPLAQGWAALSRWLIAERTLDDHLRQFARHPFARVARDLTAGRGH